MCESASDRVCPPDDYQERNVQRQPSEDLAPENSGASRQENAIERERATNTRLRLENPASSIRWSRVDDPRHWVPATAVEDEENMWTEMDSEGSGSSK